MEDWTTLPIDRELLLTTVINRRTAQAAWLVLSHPIEGADRLQNTLERLRSRSPASKEGSARLYVPDPDWEQRLHAMVGAPWPCPALDQFWPLWRQISESLDNSELKTDFCWDTGSGVGRTVWCLTRHLKPARIVETGVARGITTRLILEALGLSRQGHLWSIDLPPMQLGWNSQVAAAVPARLRSAWTYVRGSSRRRLPGLLKSLGTIDLFVHDSLHTESNMLFELEHAWHALRPGGALVMDDIFDNSAFYRFTSGLSCAEALTPAAEDGRGASFGIVLKC